MLVTVLGVLAATAAVAPLLARYLGRDAGWPIAGAFLALTIAIALQAPTVLAGETVEYAAPWIPSADIAFRLRLDGVALLFTLLVLGVGALVMAYCARYFDRTSSQSRFYLLMGIFAVAMLGLVLADDLVALFVFWELTSICSFFLIGGTSLKAGRPAMRALIVTAGGGLALLAAVALISVRAGTTQLSAVLTDLAWTEGWTGTVVALCVVIAAFTKSAQVPFHFWLPGAMAASTPVSAYLHAAAMVKAGIYLLMRFTPAFSDATVWHAFLVGAGLVTAIYGGLLALKENDLKSLAAYSTVSQLGYLVAVIGVGTPYALAAAAVHTLAHALFKATLFMMVGVIDHQTHHRDIRELGGLRHLMPVSAVVTGLAALSLAGLPPLLGFYSKEKLFAAFLEAGGGTWVGAAAGAGAMLAGVLTFGYAARFWFRVFGGEPSTRTDVREAPALFLLPAAISGAAGLVLGLTGFVLSPLAERVVVDSGFTAQTIEVPLIPHLAPELGMSLLVVMFGIALVMIADRVDDAQRRVTAPISGDTVFDWLYTGALALGRRVGNATRSQAPTRHLVPPLLLLGGIAAAVAWFAMPVPDFPAPVARPLDWLVLAVIVAGVVAVCVTRVRIAAAVLLGVVGTFLALWFLMLGAVDVALTQLVVEVLTVVVIVLVLRRLPATFHAVSRTRTAVTAAVAVATGLVAAAGTYLLTGRRELSPVSEWLMHNSEAETGGINVVNTILVDFRALDTLGEVTVVGIAALGIVALLETIRMRDAGEEREAGRPAAGEATGSGETGEPSPVDDPVDNTMVIRVVGRIIAPVIVLLSLFMLFRGHDDHGGGFIGALVAGAGLCLAHAAAADPRRSFVARLPYVPTIAGGLVLSLLVGAFGLVDGSFLRPVHIELGFTYITSSLIFDIGIYLVVVGAVIAALYRLGTPERPNGEPEVEQPTVRPWARGPSSPAAIDREPVSAGRGHDNQRGGEL